MELVHELGFDGRHTRGKRCNVPWAASNEGRTAVAAFLELLPY
jgi:hypothetical protein